jgi:hypothetical protein
MALTNDTLLHITAPYKFAQKTNTAYAQSATIAIIDPFTGGHVGQILLDFLAQPIYGALENNTVLTNKGFPLLIGVIDGVPDTVIGPGVSLDQDSIFVSEAVLTYDHSCKDKFDCSKRLEDFEQIVESMKRGESNVTTFQRRTEDGEVETLLIAYSPVLVTSVRPLNTSDYSRGVQRTENLIYSLAFVEPEPEVLGPFEDIEETTKKQTKVAISILAVVLFAAAISVVYISHRLATSFTEPMIYLLGLIQHINK